MTQSKQPFLPLAGLTVLELPGRVELAVCGGLLASLGATVHVIEGTPRHPARYRTGKQTVHPRQADDMALRADVILASPDVCLFPVRSRDDTIRCEITAYGNSGPLAGRPDSEALVQARAGIADTTGRPEGAPCLTGAPFVGMETALYAASAILAALRHRDATGQGQRIDMALYDVAVNALLTFLPLAFIGAEARRAGNRHPTLAPWNAYRAADGWVLICAPTDDQWRRLCGVMGRPDMALDPAYDTTTARFRNVAALDAAINAWTGAHPVADVVARVGAAAIPCGAIHALTDLAGDANLLHRRSLVPDGDGTLRVRNPIRAIGHDVPPVEGSSAPPLPKPARPRAMADIRVLEIGMNTVAPLACRHLGALGAEVIKVEPPTGDSNRVNMPLRDSDGQSYVFALSNTDKHGIVLDLRAPDDAAILWRLVDTADVVIENLKPGSLSRLGFGADAIRARRPGIVHCSVSGFGHDSAWPGRPALDTVVQALSGAMAATPVDGMPTKAGISIADQLGGQFGLLGILAALYWRDRTGSGVTLDIAMQDCTVWATQSAFDALEPDARLTTCLDGWIAVEAPVDMAHLPRDAALEACTARGQAVAPVLSVAEVLAAPQTAARALLLEVQTADGSHWTVLGSPLKLSATPARVRSAMPRLGWPDPLVTALTASTREAHDA